MEAINYRITEGSEYGWSCYGNYSYTLDSWNGDNDNGHSISITFDTKDQTVYQMETFDYKNRRAYRWIHPEHAYKYLNEAKHRGVDADDALDDVKFTDLEVEEDMLEKTRAIVAGEDYDTGVMIPLDLSDGELFILMKHAHKLDITFNQLVTNVLEKFVKNHPLLQTVREQLVTDLDQETHLPTWNREDDEDMWE